MSLRDDIVSLARSQIGTRESSGNVNKYSTELGYVRTGMVRGLHLLAGGQA